MKPTFEQSQLSPVGWYIASYIQRIDPVEVYENDNISDHKPWAVWENRILIKASTPDEALKRTTKKLAEQPQDYENSDGVLLRDSVVGLTSLIPIYDALKDGNEIEWIDRTGDTVLEMHERIRDNSKLEAFMTADMKRD
jgi:hypothetical protein